MFLTDLVPGPLKKLLPSLVAILLIVLSVHSGFSQERGDRVLTGRVVSEDTGEPLSNVLIELEAQGGPGPDGLHGEIQDSRNRSGGGHGEGQLLQPRIQPRAG